MLVGDPRNSMIGPFFLGTPCLFTLEVRMEKPVGLHGSRLRPISGEKVRRYLASKCRKPESESLTWKMEVVQMSP